VAWLSSFYAKCKNIQVHLWITSSTKLHETSSINSNQINTYNFCYDLQYCKCMIKNNLQQFPIWISFYPFFSLTYKLSFNFNHYFVHGINYYGKWNRQRIYLTPYKSIHVHNCTGRLIHIHILHTLWSFLCIKKKTVFCPNFHILLQCICIHIFWNVTNVSNNGICSTTTILNKLFPASLITFVSFFITLHIGLVMSNPFHFLPIIIILSKIPCKKNSTKNYYSYIQ
jgi:hypothetical protein